MVFGPKKNAKLDQICANQASNFRTHSLSLKQLQSMVIEFNFGVQQRGIWLQTSVGRLI